MVNYKLSLVSLSGIFLQLWMDEDTLKEIYREHWRQQQTINIRLWLATTIEEKNRIQDELNRFHIDWYYECRKRGARWTRIGRK